MLIIVAATLDTETLDGLMAQYDHAQSRNQREQVAEKIHGLIGGKIESMIRKRAVNLRLDPEQVSSAGWEALLTGLEQCGVTRFQRANAAHGEWGGIVQKCRPPTQAPVGARIWSLLSENLRGVLAQAPSRTCTRPVAERFIAELNAMLVRRDLYDAKAWAGIPLSNEAQMLLANLPKLGSADLTRLNCLLIASAFPEITVPQRPKANLLGYISTAVVPNMMSQLYEGATGEQSNTFLADMHAFLQPDIEAVREMEAQGTLPPEWTGLNEARRIYEHQKARIARRYGPALKWWDAQVAKYQPQNPYRVTDRGSLQSAKELLKESGVSEELWGGPKAPYYIPTRALHICGPGSIEKMLHFFGRQRPAAAQPALTPAPTGAPVPDPDMKSLADESPAQVYEYLVEKLFLPNSAESEVGKFLARNPNCTRQQAEAFVNSLPSDVGEDVRSVGWKRLVREVDEQVLDALRDPEARRKMMRDMGVVQACAAVEQVRRFYYARTARLFWLKAG